MRILFLILSLLFCVSVDAQKLTVESFAEKTNDLAARTNERVGVTYLLTVSGITTSAPRENGKQQVATPTVVAGDHEYVDLGLSVKWATCNVGASQPWEYGDYYAWGETTTKSDYSWGTYKYCRGTDDSMTKYCTNSSDGTVDNKTQLDPQDDVAHVKWGGSWRMPTRAEQDELREKCIWTLTTQSGVKGYKVTSKKNGKSIFLPAAGYRSVGGLGNAGSYGGYWSSSLYSGSSDYACSLYFDSGNVGWRSYYRYDGQSVRAVCP